MSKIPSKLKPDTIFHGGSGQTPPPAKQDDLQDLKKSGIHPKDGDYTAGSFGGKAHPMPPTESNAVAPVRDDLK